MASVGRKVDASLSPAAAASGLGRSGIFTGLCCPKPHHRQRKIHTPDGAHPELPFVLVLVLVLEHVFKTLAIASGLQTTGRCLTHDPSTSNRNHPIAVPSPIGWERVRVRALRQKHPPDREEPDAPVSLSANGIGGEGRGGASLSTQITTPQPEVHGKRPLPKIGRVSGRGPAAISLRANLPHLITSDLRNVESRLTCAR